MEIVLLIALGESGTKDLLIQISTMLVVPFAAWNALMGFTTFLHHNNPAARWFSDLDEWIASETQVTNTVHVDFEVPLDPVFHHIYKHTAHHVDVNIPFYRLKEAQTHIDELYPYSIVRENIDFTRFMSIVRTCKLYGYENHAWLDFGGNQTTVPIKIDTASQYKPLPDTGSEVRTSLRY